MLSNNKCTYHPDVVVVGPEAVAEAAVMVGVKDMVVVEVVAEAALRTKGEAAVQAHNTGCFTPKK